MALSPCVLGKHCECVAWVRGFPSFHVFQLCRNQCFLSLILSAFFFCCCCFHMISSLPHIFLTKEFPKVTWQGCKAQTSDPWAAVPAFHLNSGLIISLGELQVALCDFQPKGLEQPLQGHRIMEWIGVGGTLKLVLSQRQGHLYPKQAEHSSSQCPAGAQQGGTICAEFIPTPAKSSQNDKPS